MTRRKNLLTTAAILPNIITFKVSISNSGALSYIAEENMTWEEFINSKYNPNSPDTGNKVFGLVGDARVSYQPNLNIYHIADAYRTTVITSKTYNIVMSGGAD